MTIQPLQIAEASARKGPTPLVASIDKINEIECAAARIGRSTRANGRWVCLANNKQYGNWNERDRRNAEPVRGINIE